MMRIFCKKSGEIWRNRPQNRLDRPKIKSSHTHISQFVLFPLVSFWSFVLTLLIQAKCSEYIAVNISITIFTYDHCNAQVNNTGHHVKGNWGHCSYDCPLQDPFKEADDDRWWCSGRYVTTYLLTL